MTHHGMNTSTWTPPTGRIDDMTSNAPTTETAERLTNFVDDRCKHRATDPITTRRPREDGWRCGHEEGHTGSHTLYSAEGECVLFAGRWQAPNDAA